MLMLFVKHFVCSKLFTSSSCNYGSEKSYILTLPMRLSVFTCIESVQLYDIYATYVHFPLNKWIFYDIKELCHSLLFSVFSMFVYISVLTLP